MNGKNSITSGKTFSIKMMLPLLIVIMIGGIWLLKNADNSRVPKEDNPDFTLHVTTDLDLARLKSHGLPIIIDFGADSCIPCKEMAPVLQALNEEMRGKAIIKFVDVWKYQHLASGYPLRVIPTQVFFNKDGQPYKPADPQSLRMLLYSSKDNNDHVFTTHEGGMTKEELLAALKEMGAE